MTNTKPRIVALLPMKANSERVKGKNFRLFNGKPLFQWVLDTLLSVEEIDQVIINTDARHILAENGLVDRERVMIRDRKPEICGDFVSMNLVLGDDVANVPADMNHDPKNLIRTQDLEPWFEENSNLFVFSGESFKAANARIGLKPVMLEQRKTESIDIDDAESWEMAEAMSMYVAKKGA
jgi:CMP-N-acetylneuraminic acid synthetase